MFVKNNKPTVHSKETARLNRMSAQINGVKRIIGEPRYCPDIITQLRANSSTTKSLEADILKTNLKACVTNGFESKNIEDQDQKIEELITLFKRFYQIMKKIILMFFAISFVINSAKAEDFDSYIGKLREHPAIESILENSKKYKELSSSEMGLPDPQLIFGVDNVPVSDPSFNQFLPTAKVYGFRQQIPGYSLRKAKSNKQLVLSKKQRLLAKYSLSRLEAYFTTTLYEYDKVKKLENIFQKQIKYYKELENNLRGRLESGKSVYGRLSEMDVEKIEIEQKLNDLQVEKTQIEEEFINLVGGIPSIKLPDIKNRHLPQNIEGIYPVVIAKKDIESAKQGVNAAKAEFGPNYGVQALYKHRETGADFAGDDLFSVQATISIPLWYYWNQKPKLQAANHEISQALYSYDNIKRLWTKRMRSLVSERNFAKENIKLLENQDESMKKIISSAKRSYESGGANLESVLDARIDKLTVEAQLAMQYSRYAKLSSEFNSHLIMENENAQNIN